MLLYISLMGERPFADQGISDRKKHSYQNLHLPIVMGLTKRLSPKGCCVGVGNEFGNIFTCTFNFIMLVSQNQCCKTLAPCQFVWWIGGLLRIVKRGACPQIIIESHTEIYHRKNSTLDWWIVSTDAFGEMLAIICKWRWSAKNKSNSELKKYLSPPPPIRLIKNASHVVIAAILEKTHSTSMNPSLWRRLVSLNSLLMLIKFQSHLKKKSSYGHLFQLRIASYIVAKCDIICPSEGADRSKATSRIVRNDPCEYSDWRQRIQKGNHILNVTPVMLLRHIRIPWVVCLHVVLHSRFALLHYICVYH